MKTINRLTLSTSPLSQPARKPHKTVSFGHKRFLYRGSHRHPTGKERDIETGLYYYGARYLDSRTGRWLSGDPAIGEYVPEAPVSDEARKRNGNLPGQGGVFNYVNLHVYHYAGNNPVKYVDPSGMWLDNEDGTFTAEKGDTLWDLYGADWQEKSGYTGDPTKLQVGDVVGKPLVTTVTASGEGNGFFASAIVALSGMEIDKSWYSIDFTINETGEKFSAKYTTTAIEGEGYKLGLGVYTLFIEAHGRFEGKPPTPAQIIDSFADENISISFSLSCFGFITSESKNWKVKIGTFGVSVGTPFYGVVEKTFTKRR